MAHDCAETQSLLAAQQTMFRVAERDHGITQKLVHMDTGMSLSAIGQYVRGESAMSGAAIRKLAKMQAFPSELLSLLFEGTGRHVADNCGGDGELDALGCETATFTAQYVEAKSDGVVTPIERSKLRNRARRVAAVAKAVAA